MAPKEESFCEDIMSNSNLDSLQGAAGEPAFKAQSNLRNALTLIAFVFAVSLFLAGLVYQVSQTRDVTAGIEASSQERELVTPAH